MLFFSILLATTSVIVFILLALYILFPMAIKHYPELISHGIFLAGFCPPWDIPKLAQPRKAYKLDGVDNVYIEHPDGGKIGLWHMLPTSPPPNYDTCTEIPTCKVVLYCHGNSFHRAFGHRLCMYEKLRNEGFNVVTFDYRGYADSEGFITEDGAVSDIIVIYNWIEKTFPSARTIMVWGHSLGTALATKALCYMSHQEYRRLPDGLVLEAPFNCMEGIMHNYILSKILLKIYPSEWMSGLIYQALEKRQIYLNTQKCLRVVTCHVLILHAKDDRRVHFSLGRDLYEGMKKPGEPCMPRTITFVAFDEEHELGHNKIYQHPDLIGIVRQFVEILKGDGLNNRFFDVEI